jgi:hypothetical protein
VGTSLLLSAASYSLARPIAASGDLARFAAALDEDHANYRGRWYDPIVTDP